MGYISEFSRKSLEYIQKNSKNEFFSINSFLNNQTYSKMENSYQEDCLENMYLMPDGPGGGGGNGGNGGGTEEDEEEKKS